MYSDGTCFHCSMGCFSLVLLFLLGAPVWRAEATSPYSTTLETALRNQLYTSYEVLQRPDEKVNVSVAFNVMTINYMDIKEQTLSTSGYFYMTWSDSRLSWASNTGYVNVRFLFSNQVYTWRPAIVVENSVTDISVISDEDSLMRVNSQGQVTWTPGDIFTTSCDADVTYYPLDTQTCSVTLSTWAYTSNEIDLKLASPAIDMSYYSENGEWEVRDHWSTTEASTRESQSFSRIHFTFKLRRRPLFHIMNTIFPVILMASLTVFVFQLPPDSGERVGLCLTILLAYAVYLTLISANVPQTSVSASLLSTYLTIILILSALSVILTILVLAVYFKPEEDPVPGWLNTLTRRFLVPVTFWKRRCCTCGQKVSPDEMDTETTASSVSSSLNPSNEKNAKIRFENSKSMNGKGFENFKKEKTTVSDSDLDRSYSWKEIGLIMDRFFFYLFVILVSVATIVSMSLLASQF